MSNLSDLLPAGASGKTIEAVATANITSKAPVILNSAGTVSPIGETTVSPSAAGSLQTFAAYATEHMSVSADPFNSNRWIMAWMDDTGTKYVSARVITRSGSTLTMSAASQVYTGGNSSGIQVAWDTVTSGNFLVIYNNSVSDGSAVVGTVSGVAGSETFSYGTPLNAFSTLGLYGPCLSPLGTSGDWLVTWGNAVNLYPYGRILQVSGTTVTAGGADTIITSTVLDGNEMSASIGQASSNTKALSSYLLSGKVLKAVELTMTGTTIAVGTAATVDASIVYNNSGGIHLAAVNATTYIVAITRNTAPQTNATIPIVVTAGVISSGTSVQVSSATGSTQLSISNNLTIPNTFVVQYNDTQPTVAVGVISGTTITFGTPFVTASTLTVISSFSDIAQQSDADQYFMGIFRSSSLGAMYGYNAMGFSGGTSTNSASFVGIADAAISSAATGTVVVQGGTATGLSSLTAGSKYYVQGDGTITTVSSSVNAGLAISTTSLLLNGDS